MIMAGKDYANNTTEEMANNFTIHIDKETGHDSSYYIKKIEDCIDCYEKIHNK